MANREQAVDAAPHATARDSARSAMRGAVRACVAAFAFLTRIPVSRLVAHDVSDLSRAATWFPFVGLVVAFAGTLAFALSALIWTPLLASLVSTAATVWLTGAFHEDALADSLDGFGGGWDHSRILAIMKDSRVGAYALIGMVLALTTKVAALSAIFEHGSTTEPFQVRIRAVAFALIAAHMLGRCSSVLLMCRLPYVRVTRDGERPSAGGPFEQGVSGGQLVGASAITVVVIVATLRVDAIAVLLCALVATLLAGRYFVRRIGGITGDALGAANQGVELLVYLILAAHPFPR